MNRGEAAGILSAMRDTLKKVYLVAIDEERISALESAIGFLLAEDNNVPVKQPDLEWVKTSDRLPTKADANKESKVLGWIPGYGYRGADYKFVIGRPEHVTWWMPFPSRPEVEE